MCEQVAAVKRKRKGENRNDWKKEVNKMKRLAGIGIIGGTIGAFFTATGLPIIIGTGVGLVVAGVSCAYDLTRPIPGPVRTKAEQACDTELHVREERYKNVTEDELQRIREEKQKVWKKYGCSNLPMIEDRFENCMTVRSEEMDRLAEQTKPCNPCDPEKRRKEPDEVCDSDKDLTEEEAEAKKNRMKKKLDKDLAEKLEKFKQYQYIRPLKRFSSPRKRDFWDNYIPEDELHFYKAYPMKRFTTPKYVDGEWVHNNENNTNENNNKKNENNNNKNNEKTKQK